MNTHGLAPETTPSLLVMSVVHAQGNADTMVHRMGFGGKETCLESPSSAIHLLYNFEQISIP